MDLTVTPMQNNIKTFNTDEITRANM